MARKKRDKQQAVRIPPEKRRSNKAWATGLREDILTPHIEPFADAQDRGWTAERDYLQRVYNEFHARIDWRIPDFVEPPAPLPPYDPNEMPAEESLTEAETQSKLIRIKDLNLRIQRWLKYRVRKLRKLCAPKMDPRKNPYAILLAKLTGLKPPPKARQAYQQFMREKYQECIEGPIQASWKNNRHTPTESKPNAAYRAKIAREVFNKLPPAEQVFWAKKAQQEAAAARDDYEKALKEPPDLSPEERQRSIDNIPNLLNPIIQGIQERTKLKFFVVYGGCYPANHGEISTNHISYGKNLARNPTFFFEYQPQRFDKDVVGHFKEWLSTAYTPADIQEAALRTDILEQAKYRISPNSPDLSEDEDDSEDDSSSSSSSSDELEEIQTKSKKRKRNPRKKSKPPIFVVPSIVGTPPGDSSTSTSTSSPITPPVVPLAFLPGAGDPHFPPGLPRPTDTLLDGASNERVTQQPSPPVTGSDTSANLTVPMLVDNTSSEHSANDVLSPAIPMDVDVSTSAFTAGPALTLPAGNDTGNSSVAPRIPVATPVTPDPGVNTTIPNRVPLPTPPVAPEPPVPLSAPQAALVMTEESTDGFAASTTRAEASHPPPPALPQPPPQLSPRVPRVIQGLPSSGEDSRQDLAASPRTPPAPGNDNVPVCPPEAPSWFSSAYKAISAQNLGEDYTEILRAFCAIEKAYEYRNPNRGLPSANRPHELQRWVTGGRWRGKEPIVRDPDAFAKAWWKWWGTFQPPWRTMRRGKLLADGPYGDDWDMLAFPGQNGLLSVIGCIYWWGCRVNVDGLATNAGQYREWARATADVKWVLQGLLSHLSSSAEN